MFKRYFFYFLFYIIIQFGYTFPRLCKKNVDTFKAALVRHIWEGVDCIAKVIAARSAAIAKGEG